MPKSVLPASWLVFSESQLAAQLAALLKANSALFISTSLRRLGSDMLTVSRVRETIVQDQFGTWSLARDPILKFMFN